MSTHSEHCTESREEEERSLIQGVHFCGFIPVNFVWAITTYNKCLILIYNENSVSVGLY
jgi:hypothetical protein